MGMLTDFQLRQLDTERNKENPIIVELQGALERGSGGKYKRTTDNVVGIVRGVQPQRRGTRNLNPDEDGFIFGGSAEFQLVKKDLTDLGITERDHEGLRVLNSNMVFRVLSSAWPSRERVVRFFTERTRNEYPILSATWDFEDDVIGDNITPVNCVAKVSGTSSGISVFNEGGTNKCVLLVNEPTFFPEMSVEPLEAMEAPAVNVQFDIKVDPDTSSGVIGNIVLGNITLLSQDDGSNVLYMVVEVIDGVIHLRDSTSALFDEEITASTWVHVEVDRNLKKKLLNVTIEGTPVVEDLDISAISTMVKHVLFTGAAGSPADVYIDNVEVNCLAG